MSWIIILLQHGIECKNVKLIADIIFSTLIGIMIFVQIRHLMCIGISDDYQ